MPKSASSLRLSRSRIDAVKKRKTSTQGPPKLSDEQIRDTREKITKNLEAKLSTADSAEDPDHESPKVSAQEVAEGIERAVFASSKEIGDEYKACIRRLIISIGDEKTGFRTKLLKNELGPADFANLSVDELKSKEQQTSDETLKKEAIRRSTISELLPSDITAIKDGRDREKWGVSKSAASLDD